MLNYLRSFYRMIKSCSKPWHGRKARIRRRLEEIWQGKSEVRRDYDWIPLYFRYRQLFEKDMVDDRTWSDLEMEDVFARIDRTTSVIGRQYLYAALRIYKNDNSELQPLLSDCSRLFHFSEQVDGNRYYFDFVLRDGPCRAGNAIKLIELKGYPPELVAETRRLAADQMR